MAPIHEELLFEFLSALAQTLVHGCSGDPQPTCDFAMRHAFEILKQNGIARDFGELVNQVNQTTLFLPVPGSLRVVWGGNIGGVR